MYLHVDRFALRLIALLITRIGADPLDAAAPAKDCAHIAGLPALDAPLSLEVARAGRQPEGAAAGFRQLGDVDAAQVGVAGQLARLVLLRVAAPGGGVLLRMPTQEARRLDVREQQATRAFWLGAVIEPLSLFAIGMMVFVRRRFFV